MTTKITARGIEELKQQALTGNDEGILVLADALQSIGDSRGEFYALNHQLEKNSHTLTVDEIILYTQKRKELLQELFKVESLPDKYRLRNVFHNGDLYVIDWSKELLEFRVPLTQNEWLRETKNSLWKVPSAPVYYSSLLALHEANGVNLDREDRFEALVDCRQMHHDDFQGRRMMTSTKVIYDPLTMKPCLDSVIHGSQYGGCFSFVGPNGLIDDEELYLKYKMKYIFGTNDCQEINTVFHNLTGKFPYLIRLNEKSEHCQSSPISFTVPSNHNSDNLFLIDVGNDVPGSARGVIVRNALEFNEE